MTPTAPPLHRLLPAPAGPTTVAEAYDVARPRLADRPWIGMCMISSLDGSVTLDGTAGGLGNPNDLDVLLTLRGIADVVLVGAGTAAGEGYGKPKKAGQRIGVVTNRAAVDVDTELFRSGAGFLITNHRAVAPEGVDVLRAGDETVDLADAMRRLDEVAPGVSHVTLEGGPTLNGAMVDARLVDEIDLTMSPMIVGGDGHRVVVGATELARRYQLAHLLTDDDGYLFTRWIRPV